MSAQRYRRGSSKGPSKQRTKSMSQKHEGMQCKLMQVPATSIAPDSKWGKDSRPKRVLRTHSQGAILPECGGRPFTSKQPISYVGDVPRKLHHHMPASNKRDMDPDSSARARKAAAKWQAQFWQPQGFKYTRKTSQAGRPQEQAFPALMRPLLAEQCITYHTKRRMGRPPRHGM